LEDSYSPVDEVNDKHEQLDVDEPEES
jgi:hypothetical protein